VLEGLIKEAEEREKKPKMNWLLKHSRRSRKVKELENKAINSTSKPKKQKI
jgi:hypothetical protein